MGLDMYAYMTNEPLTDEVDFAFPEDAGDLHAWHKHPNLHGWMEQRYRAKGGDAVEFNLRGLQLTSDHLDDLEQAVCNKALPETEGFFFGASDGSEMEDDLHFIRKARAAIANGFSVYYDSWW